MPEANIHMDIFKDYPSFRRGLVIATKLDNQGHSKELESLLLAAIQEAGDNPLDLKDDPRTVIWREAHRKFGSNPNKFPPAHYSLLKRIQKPGTRIPFISKVVAIMNYTSIKSFTPVGGDDLKKAGDCLELRYANGDETFTPLGKPEVTENPVPGEIIYTVAETGDVMCRRWNWRNGNNTSITEDTDSIVMNIDVLGDESEMRAIDTRDMVAELLEKYCGAVTDRAVLNPEQPFYEFKI